MTNDKIKENPADETKLIKRSLVWHDPDEHFVLKIKNKNKFAEIYFKENFMNDGIGFIRYETYINGKAIKSNTDRMFDLFQWLFSTKEEE